MFELYDDGRKTDNPKDFEPMQVLYHYTQDLLLCYLGVSLCPSTEQVCAPTKDGGLRHLTWVTAEVRAG